MKSISITEAKARLNELVDRVEAGESIDITRRGKRVARLTAAERPRRRIELAALQAVTAALPAPTQAAAQLVRAMRDDDRY